MTAIRYPKPALISSIPRDGHAVIEASAGTGKTYTLERLVIDILLGTDATLPEILVVTFTDKGARELRERVRAAIVHILEAGAGDVPDGLPDEEVWIVDDAARARLRAALIAFDSASISTIHSFCQSVLSEFSFEVDRLLDGEQVDGRRAFGLAFREELRLRLTGDDDAGFFLRVHLEGGRVEDLEGALHDCHRERGEIGPPMDLDRFATILRGLPPYDDLIAGLRSAKASLGPKKEEAIRGLLDVADRLRRDGDPRQAILEWERWKGEAYGSSTGCKLAVQVHTKARGEGPMLDRWVEWIDGLATSASTPLGAVVTHFLPHVEARLSARKRELGQYDFDDMLTMLRAALDGPGGPALVEALRRRYRFALIDEFQDTDEVQWDVFGRIFRDSGGRNLLRLIGDPKQSIYGFRNADVHTYRAARRQILGDAAPLRLDRNWRSSPGIVETTNLLTAEGFFSEGNAEDGSARVTCARPGLRLEGPDGQRRPVVLMHLPCGQGDPLLADELKQAMWHAIAREIRAILREPAMALRHGEDALSPVEARDVHILTRSKTEGLGVGEVLRAHGIPHAFFKQEGLFETDEARDVLHLLQAIAAPDDRSARFRAWLTPFFGLGLDDAAACRDIPHDHPLVETLRSWRRLAERGRWDRLFGAVLADSGVVRRDLLLVSSERRLTNVQHILEILLEEARRRPSSIGDLVSLLESFIDGRALPSGESGDVQRIESERQAVQILTMHKAKGLEAPVVFVAGGFTSGNVPHTLDVYHDGRDRKAHLTGAHRPTEVMQAISREQQEEDERLVYVAITRARARLYLPYIGPPREGGAQSFPSAGKYPTRLKGCYSIVNSRLVRVMKEHTDVADRLFDFRDVAPPVDTEQDGDVHVDLGGWNPDPALLDEPADQSPRFDGLARRHAGFVVTSYSALKGRTGGYHVTSGAEGAEEFTAEDRSGSDAGAASPASGDGDDDLPRGAETGSFLHEVLEQVDLAEVRRAGSLDAWYGLPGVQEVFESRGARYGIPTGLMKRAREMVWAAVTSPVATGGLVLPDGIAGVDAAVPEMEFLYPIPELTHPRIDQAIPDAVDRKPFAVGRGLVRGFVDLVFEKDGRTYFLDWKSDTLPRWDDATMDRHVQANYGIQLELYALGIVRTLGIRSRVDYDARFGGVAYVFLRGTGGDGASGIWFRRPAWDDVVGWEAGLEARDYTLPGVGSLPRPRTEGGAS